MRVPGLVMLASCSLLPISASTLARDLTLPQAEKMLVDRNRELQAARRAIESADAQRLIAGG